MKDKPRVLIVDDDRHLCEALAKRLTQADFEVISAFNAKAAVDLFNQRTPDAAILDIEMRDTDGLAVCEHIRSTGSDIPVFILTGADASIIRNNLGKLVAAVGANHFFTKPYDGKTLVLTLRQAVESNHSQRIDTLAARS